MHTRNRIFCPGAFNTTYVKKTLQRHRFHFTWQEDKHFALARTTTTVHGLKRKRRRRNIPFRVVNLQNEGRVRPNDAASYRISVTKLDQDSAAVLMDVVDLADLTGPEAEFYRREVEDHWRYSVSATVASGSIEMQRILMSRSLLSTR